ncbi:MAG: hypothetical protein H0Z34_01390 [Brevibacillus sp.]|nr:hypothetical protein [Brevibacillus sp.]
MRSKMLLFIVVMLWITGCANETTTKSRILAYDDFKKTFSTFKEKFDPGQFDKISPEHLAIITASFPENNLDARGADIIDHSVEFPARYEAYYKSENSSLLVKVNFIYFPTSKEKQFVTINSISPVQNSNILEDYRKIPRPFFDEYLLSMEGYLVLINFIDINKVADGMNDQYQKSFIEDTLVFYEQFEKSLLQIHHEVLQIE